MSRKNLLVIAVAILATVGVVAILALKGFIPIAPTQGSAQSCPAPSLVYVYANDQQRNAMDSITSTFKSVLERYYGINIINMPVCSLPAQSLPQKLRVYPALLYKGDIPALTQFTVGKVGEYKLISPSISALLAYYQGINVVFGVTAEAIVLEGSAPFAKLNVSEQALKDLLTQVALANITRVLKLKPDDLGLTVQTLPTVVFRSDYNLSEGVPYLVKLRDNIYGLTNKTLSSLAQYLNIAVYETRNPPDPLLESGVPYGKNVSTILYILEDYHCPFCANLVNNLGDYLKNLVNQNRLRLVFVDLIVHPEVAGMHAFTRCIYNLTRSPEVYFNISRELYASGTATTLNDAKRIAAKYLPASIIEEAQACANNTIAHVQQTSERLVNLGYTGTPTLVFWNKLNKKGLVVVGCLQPQPCITQEQFSSILSWLESRG